VTRLIALLVAGGLLVVACGDDDAPSAATTSTDEGDLSGELTVAAAASLTEAFGDLGELFEAEHPDTTITFSFDSSGTLATQIREGAPSDVFASADDETMTDLLDEGFVAGDPTRFAANELVIVTKPGNPGGVTTLADLARLDIVAICVETAPCGKLATQALDEAGVSLDAARVTEGQNVKATLGAVTEGDADAALVYRTDALGAGDAVDTIELGVEPPPVTHYPIAVVEGADDEALAQAFLDVVVSARGLDVLASYGFLPPRDP
jgi:molybdate transport system substrate-binding protein